MWSYPTLDEAAHCWQEHTVFEIDRSTHSHTLEKIANSTEYEKTDLIFLELLFLTEK